MNAVPQHDGLDFKVQVSLLTPERYDDYDSALGKFADATIYHTRRWHGFLAEAFGVEPMTLIAHDGAALLGAFPLALQRRWRGRQLTSLPYSHRVSPLGTIEATEALWLAARRMAQETYRCPLEWRGAPSRLAQGAQPTFINTVVRIPQDEHSLRMQIRGNTRNQLVQGEGNRDLMTREAGSGSDYAAMDRIMADNRRRLGSLTYRKDFFLMLKRHLGESVRMELAYFRDEPVALMVTSVFAREAIYHYGASIAQERHARPNNLLVWNAMTWARLAGAQSFDLGTSLASQTGLIHFKEGWGGVSEPLYHLVVMPGRQAVRGAHLQDRATGRLASRVLQRLPLRLFRTITPPLLREFG